MPRLLRRLEPRRLPSLRFTTNQFKHKMQPHQHKAAGRNPRPPIACCLRPRQRAQRAFLCIRASSCPFAAFGKSPHAASLPEVIPRDYNPWAPGPYQIKMGLQPFDPEDWFQIGPDYDAYLNERERLLKEQHNVCIMSMPEAQAPAQEVLEALVQFLPRRFPQRFQLQGSVMHNLPRGESFDTDVPPEQALEVASRFVQEDLYIMQERGGDTYLTATAATMLQRVDFNEKLGRNLAGVHAPVPFYDQIRQPMINVFGRGLKAGRPLERLNWSLSDDSALFQAEFEDGTPSAPEVLPDLHPLRAAEHMTPDNAGEVASLRCERQTITRLPRTQAILFTVRTYIRSLDEAVGSRPQLAQRLASAFEHRPDSKMPVLGGEWLNSLQQYLAKVQRSSEHASASVL